MNIPTLLKIMVDDEELKDMYMSREIDEMNKFIVDEYRDVVCVIDDNLNGLQETGTGVECFVIAQIMASVRDLDINNMVFEMVRECDCYINSILSKGEVYDSFQIQKIICEFMITHNTVNDVCIANNGINFTCDNEDGEDVEEFDVLFITNTKSETDTLASYYIDGIRSQICSYVKKTTSRKKLIKLIKLIKMLKITNT